MHLTKHTMSAMKPTSTILLVDDELGGRNTLEGILRPDGYTLAFASTGAEALEKASSLLPDLILLDVMMPSMDGFEVCRRLRTIPRVAEIPVIMVTALDDRESRLAGLAAGADDFLSKPVDRLELRARVQTITRLNRYRRLVTERTKFERVVEHAPVGMLIVDAQRTITLANPAIVQLLGATDADALLGQNILTIVAPEQVERCTALLDAVFANLVEVGRTEATFVRADDGKRIHVSRWVNRLVRSQHSAGTGRSLHSVA
jgi:two-component system cell cycle response regulator